MRENEIGHVSRHRLDTIGAGGQGKHTQKEGKKNVFFIFGLFFDESTRRDGKHVGSFRTPLAQAGAMCAAAPIASPSPSFTTV